MHNTEVIKSISCKYDALYPHLSERGRRIWAATEAITLGYGGISAVSNATGISRPTIHSGIKELSTNKNKLLSDRKPGGGRKKITTKQPAILNELENLIDPSTRGDPESSLKWTCLSTQSLADQLQKRGYKISQRSICDLLTGLGYSLQSNCKRNEGSNHPDRNEQFNYIYNKVKNFEKANAPIISVDAKKKELIGNYKNNGKEWHKKGQPEKVNVYDFPDPKKAKASPYGVYDVSANEGWVSVGISHDTAEFAVATIKKWWQQMGSKRYPLAKKILITADSGGSNANRSKLWKAELQNFSDKFNLTVHISHFPPGTSKWNKIEHKMFNFISIHWRGKPLQTLNIIINLIGKTKTKEGLKIIAKLDKRKYDTGIEITNEELAAMRLTEDKFHGEWNYIIKPRQIKK